MEELRKSSGGRAAALSNDRLAPRAEPRRSMHGSPRRPFDVTSRRSDAPRIASSEIANRVPYNGTPTPTFRFLKPIAPTRVSKRLTDDARMYETDRGASRRCFLP